MDKREAIKLFAKRNSSLFKQTPFPWEAYKKLKHNFFIEQQKTPVPRDSEIATEILEGMILSLQIKSKEELDKIFKLQFFDEKLLNKEYFYQKLDIKLSQCTPLLDVDSIKKGEISEKIRNELKAEARKEIIEEGDIEVQELQKRINEKNEEYQSIPSILDGNSYPILDDSIPKEKDDQIYVPWWDKLGLKEDPFREMEGLARFDRSLYNKIVYKTKIFLKYESMAKNSFKELFRNTVVYGRWGSGKTTFFDYMCSILDDYKVRPLYIQVSADYEFRELIFDFNKKVSVELKRLCNIFIDENLSIDTLDDEQVIIELMKKLAFRGAKGFVIFVDDLHKGDDLKKAMRFLSHLQVLSSHLRRATDLNIGFLIAGSTDWESEINNNDKFLGSISRQEHMPPLEIDVALEAINKRLRTFAKNPENPRQIEKPLIERIYKRLQSNPEEITFRRVMYELLNEFESGHFDALSANPLTVSSVKLQGMRLLLDAQSKAKKQLDAIVNNPELTIYQKRHCLELLISMYLSNGLPDSEIEEVEIPFLQLLKSAGLIVKVLEKELIWKVSKDIYFANTNIISRFGLSMEDYLLKIFSEKLPEVKKASKPQNREINQIDSLMSKFEHSAEWNYLNKAKILHSKILEFREKYPDSAESSSNVINDCCDSLAQLTMAYMTYERIPIAFKRTSLEKILFWKDFWWSPEVVLQFGRAFASELDIKRKIPLVLSLYSEAFPVIVDFFKNEQEKAEIFFIHLSHLKNDEIKLFHESRNLWTNDQFKEMLELLVEAVDKKIKTFLYNIFTVLYGEGENRAKVLDHDSRNSINGANQNEYENSFTFARNEFQRLRRSNYKNLMTGIEGSTDGRRNWKNIFSSVFIKWNERTLYEYLVDLEMIQSRLDHLQVTSNSEDTIRKISYDLMMQSTTFIRSINRVYINIITRTDYLKQQKEQVTFTFCPSSIDENLKPIAVIDEDFKKVKSTFHDKNRIKVMFDDQEYVEGFFGLNYRKTYAVLALMYRGLNEKNEESDFRVHVLYSKGPEIRLAASKSPSLPTLVSKQEEDNGTENLFPTGKEGKQQTEIPNTDSFMYDVFICHATEDKEPFVRELANELQSNGLKVWYDDFSLTLGDSLRRKIDAGIANSRYGVVVLSENFFKKDWPQKELDGLVTKERNFDKVILPIWHGVNRERVQAFSPTLADRCAVSSRKGIEFVVQEILKATR